MTDLTVDIPAEPLRPRLETSGVARIGFLRLVRLELRKMVDTRAGLWLMISTALVTGIVLAIMLAVTVTQDGHPTMVDFMLAMNIPMGIFLPVLGIMAVTAEFSQRTALVSFTLVPSRLRLIYAKLAASLVVAVVAVGVGALLAGAANLLAGALTGNDVVWNLGLGEVAGYVLLHLIGMMTGFALGALFLNTAVAIVMYFVYIFVLPPIIGLGRVFLKWFDKIAPWFDFNTNTNLLLEWDLSGKDWAHLVVSSIWWLWLPLAIGLWRVVRAEVK